VKAGRILHNSGDQSRAKIALDKGRPPLNSGKPHNKLTKLKFITLEISNRESIVKILPIPFEPEGLGELRV
jgi:hypothetical protein